MVKTISVVKASSAPPLKIVKPFRWDCANNAFLYLCCTNLRLRHKINNRWRTYNSGRQHCLLVLSRGQFLSADAHAYVDLPRESSVSNSQLDGTHGLISGLAKPSIARRKFDNGISLRQYQTTNR
ncbi:hypothetical protein KEM48_003824 [Puccinia striiformis f. sp. tritici PST-130]|nr:hypothetical protein H4Q26_003742 [Puccinia striiformis f. sp. tritici PST-130]KAI9613274.1 hypothetical protein KEM48_003824 [Puccinia striiformis f. sp. tritici PST-130]